MKAKLVLATHNQAKLKRYQSLLAPLNFNLITLSDVGVTHDVEETELTFEANALLKAKAYFALTQLPVLAEDGGLEIDALAGWPGIHSRRIWGANKPKATDDQAIAEVMARMRGVPPENRSAKFVVVIALQTDGQTVFLGRGEEYGSIALTPSQIIEPGFPYRSIFIPRGETKTEIDLRRGKEIKDYLSQRKQAILELMPHLRALAQKSL
jgi:XTP/dITP diphosphohydrolase